MKVVKNKVAPPFRQVEFDIYYGEGVCAGAELLDMGVDYGMVRKSGSWFAMGEERLGQGKENSRQTLKSRPDLMDRIRNHVLREAGLLEPSPTDVQTPVVQPEAK